MNDFQHKIVTEPSPETRDSLLIRLTDPDDHQAWLAFVETYRSLIYRMGRRHGMQHADAQNLVQDVLCKVQRKVGDWQTGQASGCFRRWLATVARNTAIDSLRRIRPDTARGGTSIQQQLGQVALSDEQASAELRLELERETFRQAARRIQGEFCEATWCAFWDTTVQGQSCADVARQLGKSVGAIYTSRSRVMQRLREEISQLDWQSGFEQCEQE